MDDINIWYDAYTAYLQHQLTRQGAQDATWRPDVVLNAVERLWPPDQAPRWDHLIEGLRWAVSEHEHRDEFAIALALAEKMAAEHAEEQKRLEGWEEQPTGYFDHDYARRQAEWERTRKFLHGDEDSTYFWERFRWINGG